MMRSIALAYEDEGCEPACVFQDEDHDQCARLHEDCDGRGCDGCHDGLLWVVP